MISPWPSPNATEEDNATTSSCIASPTRITATTIVAAPNDNEDDTITTGVNNSAGIVDVVNGDATATTSTPIDTAIPTTTATATVGNSNNKRRGTIASATFNIWSTMVGGGSLSLPLAFYKMGNIFLGPVLLIIIATITQFCFHLLIDCCSSTTSSDIDHHGNESNRNDTVPDPHPSEHSPMNLTTHDGRTTNEYCADHHQDTNNYHHDEEEERIGLVPTQTTTTTANDTDDQTMRSIRLQMRGTDTLETITSTAFGIRAYTASASLVYFMCWFGAIGYCVLLRDMLVPITNIILSYVHHHHHHYPSSNDPIEGSTTTVTLANNMAMILVVLFITPLCTLQTLTSLQSFSTLSMMAIFVLGSCIVYRSIQCATGYYPSPNSNNTTINMASSIFPLGKESYYHDDSSINDNHHQNNSSAFEFFPRSFKDVLDVLPLFISCYVCHYNIPIVHNDLMIHQPNRSHRSVVQRWLSISVWGATLFYCIIGIAGSSFAVSCSPTTSVVQGNILLNFDPTDPLLFVGRLCLAITIALALPVLTIPARDIVLRYYNNTASSSASIPSVRAATTATTSNDLTEPLLSPASNDDYDASLDETIRRSNVQQQEVTSPSNANLSSSSSSNSNSDDVSSRSTSTPSLLQRLLVSILILWSGTFVACCVSSIDIVWDFLGSSLSIVLSYLVPSGCYIVLKQQQQRRASNGRYSNVSSFRVTICWIMLLFFTPLMVLSTVNAIYNLLLHKS